MKITVIGAGAYGIALANLLYSNKNEVTIWTKFKEELEMLLLKRENEKVLKGIKISDQINITDDLESAIKNTKIIVIAVPTFAVSSVCLEISKYLTKDQIICITSKGITSTGNIISDELLKNIEGLKKEQLAVLSGPSFAIEMAKSNSLGLVSASTDIEVANTIKEVFQNENVEIELSSDIDSVELLGAMKNIYAIAMGIISSLGISESTKAKLITKYLNDMGHIVVSLGGNKETLYTFAGMGDFLLTTMSDKSRNFSFGKYIGMGNSKDKALELLGVTTVEGLFTSKHIFELLKSKNIQAKEVEKIYDVLYNNKDVTTLINN